MANAPETIETNEDAAFFEAVATIMATVQTYYKRTGKQLNQLEFSQDGVFLNEVVQVDVSTPWGPGRVSLSTEQ